MVSGSQAGSASASWPTVERSDGETAAVSAGGNGSNCAAMAAR